MSYDKNYYKHNAQDKDRPALWMYERLWRRYLGSGPVLDFGCGLGHFACRLSRHTETYGLETNPHALQQIRGSRNGFNLISSTSDIMSGSLGSITALHVFEHISDDNLMQIGVEFNRLLRPGGRVLAVMPDLDGKAHALKGSLWSAFNDKTHINLKGCTAWRSFFQQKWGLHTVTSFSDGYYDFPYISLSLRTPFGDGFRMIKTLAQFLIARPLLPAGDGENIVFILEKQR